MFCTLCVRRYVCMYICTVISKYMYCIVESQLYSEGTVTDDADATAVAATCMYLRMFWEREFDPQTLISLHSLYLFRVWNLNTRFKTTHITHQILEYLHSASVREEMYVRTDVCSRNISDKIPHKQTLGYVTVMNSSKQKSAFPGSRLKHTLVYIYRIRI